MDMNSLTDVPRHHFGSSSPLQINALHAHLIKSSTHDLRGGGSGHGPAELLRVGCPSPSSANPGKKDQKISSSLLLVAFGSMKGEGGEMHLNIMYCATFCTHLVLLQYATTHRRQEKKRAHCYIITVNGIPFLIGMSNTIITVSRARRNFVTWVGNEASKRTIKKHVPPNIYMDVQNFQTNAAEEQRRSLSFVNVYRYPAPSH